MAQTSPPKPWERGGSTPAQSATAPSTTATTASPSSTGPAIPERPSSLAAVVNRTASNYSTGGANTAANTSTSAATAANTANRPYNYNSSPYGYGGYSAYSSPYSRLGGGMYGGGMYGGGMYGGGMYGAGGMYGGGMYGSGGAMGAPGDPNNNLTNNFAQSTQATFQMIESIVGAFGGFAQMLESTYMATHSSFFAMVSVAEQFGNLRQTLGQVLGIYTVLRWLRTLLARLTGRPPPADATSLTPANFFAFTNPGAAAAAANDPNRPPRPSKKPFIVFLLAVFGLPYLMGKLIRALAKSQEEALAREQQQQLQLQQQVVDPNTGELVPQLPTAGLDPSKLDFCRVLYDFPPPEAVASGTYDAGLDLAVKKGDLVAVLDKSDPQGQPGQEGSWWRCRARDGRMGWLPAVYLETLQRRPQGQRLLTSDAAQAQSAPGSRANTMPAAVTGAGPFTDGGKGTSSANGSRAQTLRTSTMGGNAQSRTASLTAKGAVAGKEAPAMSGGGANGVEAFQKAWVNER